MHARLFLTTFALIFLAELGDKTQLAAMARAASADAAKWTIFLAASSALVLSTLLAVLLGSALTRLVPEHTIRISAGVLFILFGVMILHGVWAGERAAAAPAPAGLMSKAVVMLAAQFEEAASRDYERLAGRVRDPALRSVLETLASEEAGHLERLRTVRRENADVRLEAGALADGHVAHDVADAKNRPILEHAIEHERAMARFYSELARLTPIPSLRQVFLSLAAAEQDHVTRLEALQSDDKEAKPNAARLT